MYRSTSKQQKVAEKMEKMRDGKERSRLRYAEQRSELLPDLRIRITVERFDCGEEKHIFELRKSNRIDVYNVFVDSKPWKKCGLSGVLTGIRKAMPRILSEYQ